MKDKSKIKEAETHFKVLTSFYRLNLISARLITGRRHQIRRHLAHKALQILGDTTHGKGKINQFFRESHGLTRMCLHAHRLEFFHPMKKIQVEIVDRIPDDLRTFLQRLPEPPDPNILDKL